MLISCCITIVEKFRFDSMSKAFSNVIELSEDTSIGRDIFPGKIIKFVFHALKSPLSNGKIVKVMKNMNNISFKN